VAVVDDGVGGASTERGSGLRGLADRVSAVDGSLAVVSPPGEGTQVRARIPYRASEVVSPADAEKPPARTGQVA
jgi:glucose-6-phosphate-specific signal transduction histidine kinase